VAVAVQFVRAPVRTQSAGHQSATPETRNYSSKQSTVRQGHSLISKYRPRTTVTDHDLRNRRMGDLKIRQVWVRVPVGAHYFAWLALFCQLLGTLRRPIWLQNWLHASEEASASRSTANICLHARRCCVNAHAVPALVATMPAWRSW
jgi:hypothetical protein